MAKYIWPSLLLTCAALAGAGCGSEVTGGSGAGGGGAGGGSTTGAGATSGAGGAGSCATDSDCVSGMQWCVQGACVPCDNSGQVCDIACTDGWQTYERNGCFPCACAPTNECTADADCPNSPAQCYAGAFCWDWCPPGDPSCCFGNQCSLPGCSDPNPVGCFIQGCAPGHDCTSSGCVSSSCGCDGNGGWVCTDDCGGGTCTP